MEPDKPALGREGPVHSTTSLSVWILTGFRDVSFYREILCVAKTMDEINRCIKHNTHRNYNRFEINQMPVWE